MFAGKSGLSIVLSLAAVLLLSQVAEAKNNSKKNDRDFQATLSITDAQARVFKSILKADSSPYNLLLAKDAFFRIRPYKQDNVGDFRLRDQQALNASNSFITEDQEPFSLFSYLMRSEINSNYQYYLDYLLDKDTSKVKLWFNQIWDNPCEGLAPIEADIKQHCNFKGDSAGLLMLPYKVYSVKGVADGEKINYDNNQLLTNGSSPNYSAIIYRSLPYFMGMFSNSDGVHFRKPISTFDSHLYSELTGRAVSAGDPFSNYGEKCSYKMPHRCSFYFSGKYVNKLLSQHGYFDASINFNKSEYPDKFNLKALIGDGGVVRFDLKNSLLSDSQFINYGFYNELELAVLHDLGYDIDPREFYGHSIYSSGTPQIRGEHNIGSGFFSWNRVSTSYNFNTASVVPLGVGTHIYGSYNDVTQTGPISSEGYGSLGIRVDGSHNSVTIPVKNRITMSGDKSSALAVTYGCDNVLNINGRIESLGDDGVGIMMSYGSNVLSDRVEYRGSYQRVRTLDYITGKRSFEEAQSVGLLPELREPMVKRVNISGMIYGKKYSILIGRNSHVREISLLGQSIVSGDILSEWRPYIDKGNLYCMPMGQGVLPAKLQISYRNTFVNPGGNADFIGDYRTYLNLGGILNDKGELETGNLGYTPNPNARTEIKGSIDAPSFDIRSIGGVSFIKGVVLANSLNIENSVLRIDDSNESGASLINDFTLGQGGVLDLVNDGSTSLTVINRAKVGPKAYIRVDTDDKGNILDSIIFDNGVQSMDGNIYVEPGLNHLDFQHLTSDPKAFFKFVKNFTANANEMFSQYKISVRAPKHIWYNTSDRGRELQCSARGCHLGGVVAISEIGTFSAEPWRYYVSIAGTFLLLLITFLYTKKIKSERSAFSHRIDKKNAV